jgi:hypothetical protein
MPHPRAGDLIYWPERGLMDRSLRWPRVSRWSPSTGHNRPAIGSSSEDIMMRDCVVAMRAGVLQLIVNAASVSLPDTRVRQPCGANRRRLDGRISEGVTALVMRHPTGIAMRFAAARAHRARGACRAVSVIGRTRVGPHR